MLLLPILLPVIAIFAYVFQLRAAERRRTNGGSLTGTLRGALHAACVIGLGVSCPHVFEVTLAVSPGALGLACGALGAITSFVLALTFADKAIDSLLASLIADSNGVELLALRDLARLEVPDVALFSTLMIGWAAIANL